MLVLSSGAGGVGHGIRPPQPVGAKFPSSISPSPKLQRFAVPVTTTGAIAPPAVASAAAGSVVPNPGQILIKTTLASGPAAAAGPTVAAATGPGKDNVYIVTLANQDQIKNLDTASIVQQIQAQQSGQGVKGSPSQMVTLAGGVSAKGVIPLTAGVGATTVGIPVSASARDTISLMSSGVLPKVPSAEKRNVAEILASLSGLMPEPQASATAPPITTSAGSGQTAAHTSTMTASSSSTPMGKPAPSILGGNSGAGRLVRVKQQSARPVPGSTATATTIAAGSTTSMSQPGTARVRKQVFVTAPQAAAAAASATASSSSSSGTAAPDSKKEEQSKSSTSEPAAKEGGESATPKESEGSSSTAAAIPSADRSVVRDDSEMVQVEEHTGEHEQDILEEDVNDAEYVPSFKKGGGHKNRTASAKAKPKK